jgi:hypothetical protein
MRLGGSDGEIGGLITCGKRGGRSWKRLRIATGRTERSDENQIGSPKRGIYILDSLGGVSYYKT